MILADAIVRNGRAPAAPHLPLGGSLIPRGAPLEPPAPMPAAAPEPPRLSPPTTPNVSILSSALQKIGIPKGVQTAALGGVATAVGGPGLGAIVTAASAASKLPSPFAGVVPPGGSQMINSIFNLGPQRGQIAAGTKGYHLNKHALPACKSHGAVPARSIMVRNRHRNPANGAAIRRAASRLKSAEKLFRKVLTVQGKHHGTIKPKGRRR